MISSVLKNDVKSDISMEIDKLSTIKRVYDKNNALSVVQVLNSDNRIVKCLFFDETERLSNISFYNPDSGKEIKNVTYRQDGKTISSVRDYEYESGRLVSVSFFKPDGKSISSIIEYNEYGDEIQFSIYCDNGEVISAAI